MEICIIDNVTTRPHGQSVKTPPFHGGMRGSIPLEATTGEEPVFFILLKII